MRKLKQKIWEIVLKIVQPIFGLEDWEVEQAPKQLSKMSCREIIKLNIKNHIYEHPKNKRPKL